MSKRLLELARVRTTTLSIAGEELVVREPSALEIIERRQRTFQEIEEDGPNGEKITRRVLRPDATELGLAYLISRCIVTQAGVPVYSAEEAMVIARGRPEVSLPIINAITGFLADEKKALPMSSGSGIA